MAESVTKRVARNFSWLFFGNGLNGLLMLGLSVYLARILGVAAYGLYQFAQAFLIYLVLLVDNGLSIFGAQEIAKDRAQAGRIGLNLLAVRFLVACVLFAGAAVLLAYLPLGRQLRLIFLATFAFSFYRALSPEWIFQGLEKMELIPAYKLFITLITLALTLWLIHGPRDLLVLLMIQASAGLILTILLLLIVFQWLIPTARKLLTPRAWPSLFLQAWPLGASVFLIQIYGNLDTIMLGVMSRQEIVGYYNAAYKVFFACLGIFAVWQQTALPVMSWRLANDLPAARLFINKYARLTALVFMPLTILIFLLAPAIISVIFGSAYLPAVPALRVLIWQMISIIIGSTFGILILIPVGRAKEFLSAVAVGALINIILNFLLIPRFSMIGAALATICAEVAAMLTVVYLARRVLGWGLVKQGVRPAALAILALLGYGLVLTLNWPFNFIWRQLLAGCGYILMYSALVLRAERNFIFSFIGEIRKR